MTSPIPSPFSHCPNGHDLTDRAAWFYDRNSNRQCRVCQATENTKAKRPTFSPMWADQSSKGEL